MGVIDIQLWLHLKKCTAKSTNDVTFLLSYMKAIKNQEDRHLPSVLHISSISRVIKVKIFNK